MTVGDHLRAKRLDLNLWQKDVAKKVGVSELTITNWENGNSLPQIQFYPEIIRFLGYCPLEINIETLAGKMVFYRHLYGLAQKDLGKQIGVDGSTICSWENNEFVPHPDNLKLLNKLFEEISVDQVSLIKPVD